MRKAFILTAALVLAVLGPQPVYAEVAPTTAAALLPAANVSVRAGAHEDFDRIVFDWPRQVDVHVRTEASRAIITFDASANILFARDLTAKLTRARGFIAHADDPNHVSVSFVIDSKSGIKAFASGTSVVIDVTGKAAPDPAQPQTVSQPVPAPAATPSAATAPAPAKPVPPVVDPSSPVDPTSPKLSMPEIKVPELAQAPKPPQPALAPSVGPNTATDKPQPLVSPPALALAPIPARPPASATSALTKPAVTSVQPANTQPQTPPTTSTPPLASSGALPAVPTKTNAASLPELADIPALVVTLDPHVPARATIYQRAGYGYVVFERKLTLSPETLANGAVIHADMQPMDLPKNSGFRFPLPRNAELHATRDGTAWKILVSKTHTEVPVTTSLVAQPDFALGPRFLLPLPDAPEPIRMTDPVVGDNLILIPLGQSEAFNAERHMADFAILPAAQGLVLKPLTDKIIVHAVSDGIEITTNGGLLLSRSIDTGAAQQSATKARALAAGKSIFDFATWQGKSDENFTKTRQRLQQTIVDVPESERNRARLELARFYFANGNGEEAIALLNMLGKDVPDLKTHGDFVALLGAAEVLASRPEDGLRDLDNPLLAGQPEVELWQAVGLAQQRNWQGAEEKFAVTESILAGYPEPFFSRFLVLAIESAIAQSKDHEAADWLNYLSTAPHSDSIEPALAYLHGALDVKGHRANAAQESWKEAQNSNDQLYKVRAELALIDLGVSTNSLTPAQAADRLEALRFAWRGDDLEVDILHRLGQFYIQAKNVKVGLNTLSQAVSLYPSSPITPIIRAEMATIFHDVFLGELGKKLSPLDALTLYQQYRELMPTGKDGDFVMRNLAERLVAIDLLDQASSILEDLAKNHLQGEEKGRAALRLAGIQLLDHKPDAALAALDLVGAEVLQAAQQNERILLRARALTELKRYSEASAALKDNKSSGALMLRADIAMRTQAWNDAAQALMELVGPPPATDKALSPEQTGWLLNAAIAFALADDQTNLDKLAIDYNTAMSTTSQSDTFRMLTQPEKSGEMRDLAAAQAQITQVDMFQGFLNNYRAAATDVAATKPAQP